MTLGEILKNKNIGTKEQKKNLRVTCEFQDYALRIAEKLNDKAHIGIYMRLTKFTSAAIIDHALSFVADARANNPAALFMWKVKQLKIKK